jgi:hypothetical protein
MTVRDDKLRFLHVYAEKSLVELLVNRADLPESLLNHAFGSLFAVNTIFENCPVFYRAFFKSNTDTDDFQSKRFFGNHSKSFDAREIGQSSGAIRDFACIM